MSSASMTAAEALAQYRYALARSAADIPRLVEVFTGRWHKTLTATQLQSPEIFT